MQLLRPKSAALTIPAVSDDGADGGHHGRGAAQLSPEELAYRQFIVDLVWERTLAERQHRREVVERRSFHKALGDPDWIK
jgi:hypothetical protein